MRKRGFLFFLVLFIVLSSWSNVVAKVEEKPSKKVCIEEYEKRWAKFNGEILADIIASYDLEFKKFKELAMNDLPNKMRIGEKNEDIHSLLRLFEGKSIGDRRLFLKDNKGYLLFKRTDGKNVLKKLEQDSPNGKWIITNTKEIEGKIIKWEKFDWSRCKEN